MTRSLPRIAPYDFAVASERPPGDVGWTLQISRAALLVHDMQEYFAAAFDRTTSPFVDAVGNIGRLIAAARRAGVPVIFSAQPGDQAPEQRALLTDFWGPGMTADPAQQAIIADLAPHDDDILITKWRYSAFQRTELHAVLAAAGRNQLVVTGVYAHIGCLATSIEAFMTDIQPFFVADAVADFSLADHRMAVEYAARRCAAVLATTDVEQAFAAGATVSGSGSPAPAMDRAWLRGEVAARVGEPVADDDDLIEVGLDSVHVMEIVEQLQASGRAVGFADLAERFTLDEWFDLVGI